MAGWGFVVGKTASCAAMALTFAAYAVPGPAWIQRIVGATAVIGLTVVNLRGITRTAGLARLLVIASLVALAVVVLVALASGRAAAENLALDGVPRGPYGVLQASGLLFFAFAGYARIATLGEEVRDPGRTIPRAIPLALGITVVVYVAVGATALAVLGPSALAAAAAPLAAVVDAAGAAWAEPVVRAGATVASLGALLALIAGIGRTALAMARQGDLPRALAAVDARHQVPRAAEIAVAVAVIILVALSDLRNAIGFSSFGVLVYYTIANASAFTQRAPHRRWPRIINVLGGLGCATLALSLPVGAVLVGAAVLALGVAGRGLAHRFINVLP